MDGPEIVARTLSDLMPPDKKYGNRWQYHPRSDRHSKIACWAIMFDLMQACPLLAEHVSSGEVGFGINHEMRDFETGRKKDLDLVICRRGTPQPDKRPRERSFAELGAKYQIRLSDRQAETLAELPQFQEAAVGEVYLALEAKACMTAHSKARPRLYDELSSSHMTIHGSSDFAIAVGFVMVNGGDEFASPGENRWSVSEKPIEYNRHKQPKDAEEVIAKISEIQRRSKMGGVGFDALGLILVRCPNDGAPVEILTDDPAPQPQDILHYDSMIHKIAGHYQARF